MNVIHEMTRRLIFKIISTIYLWCNSKFVEQIMAPAYLVMQVIKL